MSLTVSTRTSHSVLLTWNPVANADATVTLVDSAGVTKSHPLAAPPLTVDQLTAATRYEVTLELKSNSGAILSLESLQVWTRPDAPLSAPVAVALTVLGKGVANSWDLSAEMTALASAFVEVGRSFSLPPTFQVAASGRPAKGAWIDAGLPSGQVTYALRISLPTPAGANESEWGPAATVYVSADNSELWNPASPVSGKGEARYAVAAKGEFEPDKNSCDKPDEKNPWEQNSSSNNDGSSDGDNKTGNQDSGDGRAGRDTQADGLGNQRYEPAHDPFSQRAISIEFRNPLPDPSGADAPTPSAPERKTERRPEIKTQKEKSNPSQSEKSGPVAGPEKSRSIEESSKWTKEDDKEVKSLIRQSLERSGGDVSLALKDLRDRRQLKENYYNSNLASAADYLRARLLTLKWGGAVTSVGVEGYMALKKGNLIPREGPGPVSPYTPAEHEWMRKGIEDQEAEGDRKVGIYLKRR